MPCLTFIVGVWMPFPVCLQNFGPLDLVPPTLGAVSYSPVDFAVAAGINVRLCLLPPTSCCPRRPRNEWGHPDKHSILSSPQGIHCRPPDVLRAFPCMHPLLLSFHVMHASSPYLPLFRLV
jgi:hypothetical protein